MSNPKDDPEDDDDGEPKSWFSEEMRKMDERSEREWRELLPERTPEEIEEHQRYLHDEKVRADVRAADAPRIEARIEALKDHWQEKIRSARIEAFAGGILVAWLLDVVVGIFR